MAKGTPRRATPAPKPKPKPDYDAGIREQLEPYGLELNDIVAVLEEDPELMQYVTQGQKGASLAAAAQRPKESVGYCASGVRRTTERSLARNIHGNGNDIHLSAQETGDYFTLTYPTAETADSLRYAPNGAILNWDNQDTPSNRTGTGGFRYGHVTVKTGDGKFFSDHPETADGNVNLVLHKGRNNGPRYGSLSYVTFPKDVTFSPELIELAMMRKRERETDREIPLAEMPKQPNTQKMTEFFRANPRIGYMALKRVNPDVSLDLAADGGKKLIPYYNSLPSNSPERAALNLLVSKGIPNAMDYAQISTVIDEVSDEVLRLRNPEAHARQTRAKDGQITALCNVTPTYIYQLQQALTGDATRMSSREYREYIAGLNPNSPEYLAISELAKRGLRAEINPVEVKLAVANIAKDHREVKPEEINSLFENTPGLVYHVQKEFGTQKEGGIRTTSELHEYYNNLPANSPERKAIDELAMAHIEISEADTPRLDEAISAMAHHYKPDRELEPRQHVSLGIKNPIKGVIPSQDLLLTQEERNAVKAGFERIDEQTWDALVNDYVQSTQEGNNGQTREELRQQKEEASQRMDTVLQNLFAEDGNVDCKAVMKNSRKLFNEYMALEDGSEKSLEGFVKFIEKAPTDRLVQVYLPLSPVVQRRSSGR